MTMKEKIIAWVKESSGVHMALVALVAAVVLGALIGLLKTVI